MKTTKEGRWVAPEMIDRWDLISDIEELEAQVAKLKEAHEVMKKQLLNFSEWYCAWGEEGFALSLRETSKETIKQVKQIIDNNENHTPETDH